MNCRVFFILSFLITLFSCEQSALDVPLEKPIKNYKMLEYDEALFELDPFTIEEKLDSLAKIYPIFINGNYNSPSAIKSLMDYMENPLNKKLYQEAQDQEVAFNKSKKQLNLAWNYFKYYFPNDTVPTCYFYISGLNYEQAIIFPDSENILIGKDLFLGSDYKVYEQYQIPKFISQKMKMTNMPYQVIRQFAYQKFSDKLEGENLLETMIALGKVEYFVHALFPQSNTQERFAFKKEQMEWCNNKERAFWKHLTEEQMLFNTDFHDYKKYIEERPFISSMERASPGRAGIWIGYRIVQKYMNNEKTDLKTLMANEDLMQIFKASKYNP